MNILIIDDHPLTCHGLTALLSASAPEEAEPRRAFSVHSASQARAALAEPPPPDWVFLDIRLPDDPDHTLFEELCGSAWATRTVLISAVMPQPLVRQALGAGMRGFIPKSADPAMVLEGFAALVRGEVYLPPKLSMLANAAATTQAGKAAYRGLSPRLREVLTRVLRGASNKVIARELGVSEHTVKEYMSSILAYHDVSNRLELVLKLKSRDGAE